MEPLGGIETPVSLFGRDGEGHARAWRGRMRVCNLRPLGAAKESQKEGQKGGQKDQKRCCKSCRNAGCSGGCRHAQPVRLKLECQTTEARGHQAGQYAARCAGRAIGQGGCLGGQGVGWEGWRGWRRGRRGVTLARDPPSSGRAATQAAWGSWQRPAASSKQWAWAVGGEQGG